MRITAAVERLGIESAFEVLAHAQRLEAQGREVVHLEVGEPDFPTPPHVVEAGVRALRDGATRYVAAAGLADLREAIAAHLAARGIAARPEQVVVTSGAKPMLFYALVALLEPGSEALVPDPGFPIYPSVVRFAGAKPVGYGMDVARDGAIDLDEVAARISPATRVLVINTPHNPTGAVLDERELVGLAELAVRHDLAVVSDEIYSQLVFDGAHATIAALPGMAERTVLVDGFSKAYAMTGWRLGYGLLPGPLASRVERLVVNTTSCAPAFVQQAGLAALTGPQDGVRRMCRELAERRDQFVAGLNRIPELSCPLPRGAFYAFADAAGILRPLGLSAERFAAGLLQRVGLACLGGGAFGPRGANRLRFSFASSRSNLARALALLYDALGGDAGRSLADPGLPGDSWNAAD